VSDQKTADEPSTTTRGDWRSQFAHPTGGLGTLVGFAMAVKSRRRSLWVLSLLHLQPDDRVLEIGFGPGVDIRRASQVASFVAGIDHSAVMVQQARRRNRAALRAGQVDVRQGTIADPLPFADGAFTKVFAINSYQFWPDPVASIRELRRVLRPGGVIAIAIQPRWRGATDGDARRVGEETSALLQDEGFASPHVEVRSMKPVAVSCALGIRPS
jgi:SAM-dependent methyltransferase